MFSDELIGLDIAHRREQRQLTDHAQSMLNSQAADIGLLTRALRKARDDLAKAERERDAERRQRMALQLELDRLNRLLDTPVG